jgi:hypothetical protein
MRRVVYAANQPQYNPLPALVDAEGTVHTRWQLTEDERRAIMDGACVTLALMTFGDPLQPIRLGVEGIGEPVEQEMRR